MKAILMILVMILLTTSMLLAVPITLTYRDTSTATRSLIWTELPTYPSPTPTDGSYDRWIYKMYKTTDNVIDPLDSNGNPTGDDVLATNYIQQGFVDNEGKLNLGPTGGFTVNSPALNAYDAGASETLIYHSIGQKIYLRVFNSSSLATATKSIAWATPLTVLSATATINFTPTPGWSAVGWVTHATIASSPNPAILVYPTPSGVSNLGFSGQTLSWEPDTTAPLPTGYKVYFGTNDEPSDLVSTQVGTTYATGLLLPETTYFWKVVPFVLGGPEAEDCPIWTFTTRGEVNPNSAENPSPADNETLYSASFPFIQTLSWSAPSQGVIPTGYKLYWNGEQSYSDLGNVLTTTKSIATAATYTWKIVPYYTDPGTRNTVDGKPLATKVVKINNPRGDATDCPEWSFSVLETPSYNVNVTSNPSGAEIYVNDVNSGFTTPHIFTLIEGSSATYRVEKAGYTWNPEESLVSNIEENVTLTFTGTLLTYTVEITSTPSNAEIMLDGVSSGFSTPHTFTLNYNASAMFSVAYDGYDFVPDLFEVSNIQANTSQHFTGTIRTYSVQILSNPDNADIYVDGVDSGFNTPHQFTMQYGTSAIYTVQKVGYTWSPTEFAVNSIQSNTNQTFIGTLLTYTVDLTSSPTGARILVDGVDSGNVTPYQFVLNHGTTSTFSVQKDGYTYIPEEFTITNLDANKTQHFTGTINTYTVDITSTPTGASIQVTGARVTQIETTPHQYVLEYGSSATYRVSMNGYDWSPQEFIVNNISSNQSQHFVGTLQSFNVEITSDPSNADIYVGNINTGFKTPHTFNMNYGTSATYTVQKDGYTWAPSSFAVNNIQANTSQNFTGTLLTYTVDITSDPSNVVIYVNGESTDEVTPHQFIMEYGTSAEYTLVEPGYTWTPTRLTVSNIQANTNQHFVGTAGTYLLTVTSSPSNAAIFMNSIDTGFTTPHEFVITHGSNAIFSVSKPGYSWDPESYNLANVTSSQTIEFVGTLLTYTVEITSNPTNSDIYLDGVDSGFNTPYTFTMDYGTNAIYSIQREGYTWNPVNFEVNNIQANTSQHFTGTIITFTVDITSTPSGAAIYVDGFKSIGPVTPHQFTLEYGSGAIYYVEKPGYSFTPESFVVNNIQSNRSQHFTGTILTYSVNITSTPADADIYIDGVDSGFNTPHIFTMNYGSDAIYSVQKEGYTWSPENYVITNIQENDGQHFTGTLLTYSVNITSEPTNSFIYVNGDYSGFNTPHTFTMDYGTSATYMVYRPGYSSDPINFVVENIQANMRQHFALTILTYAVNITSTPIGADIYINGQDSGYTTPHIFTMEYGTNATYSAQMAGYTWDPTSFAVNNIQANTGQHFTGTIITYTVNITSNPTDADIYIGGIDSGFNTPHIFTMNYGTSATYTVQKAGYTWNPNNFVVTNIQANTSQNFVGTIITFNVDITSTPTGAAILLNGQSTEFVTPHTFVMNYGTNATYAVAMEGYSWIPSIFEVTNIQGNTSRHFIGTLGAYTVTLTSNPSGANIYEGGFNTGFTTPHEFVLYHGSNASYAVQKAGYTWSPEVFNINHITSNTSQNFAGTIITYNVNITSSPTGAGIFINGVSSGYSTPHQFVMNYGTSATYTVQSEGYTWNPGNFVVTNIQANTSQQFIGTLQTYTVEITSNPSGAQIFSQGFGTISGRIGSYGYTGYTTPHTFTLDYGTSIIYYVEKLGYTWAPETFAVNYIQANTSQHFVGSIITYSVNITSTPANADIYVNGIDSGYNTPHNFTMNYGTNATYTVQKAGYTWQPTNFVVNNIMENKANNFVGTIITYNVNITSSPSDARIYIGGNYTGYNTPHQFTMDYGTNAVYTVQKDGYNWAPASFNVNNIQANTTQNFVGTLMTYSVNITSNPSGASIYVGGNYSGYSTPYTFTMDYGTSATYSVQREGYTWNPNNFVVNNIQANTSQNFTGTIITFTVNITSDPVGADILINGADSGFDTPYSVVMDYGTNAVYSLFKSGYVWDVTNFPVNNITSNQAQHFNGTLLTYNVNITSVPTNSAIYVDGVNTGFTTPNNFVMNYGTSATYTIQREGYSWVPESYIVSNIQTNLSKNFIGTLSTYTVNITSEPIDADIYVNGLDTGFNTPHQFTINHGSNALYTVKKTGYFWTPSSFVVNNIQANTAQHFVGAQNLLVNITSTPSNARIFVNGQDSGFSTPHVFTLAYGSNAVYTVSKTGYIWSPANFVVENIQQNLAQEFTGTLQVFNVNITSNPSGANIYVNGQSTGFTTPHQFAMSYGSGATYTVQQAGYTWAPSSFVVNNITSDMAQNFMGTILTYTVYVTSSPSNADIFINGVDSGFNTPYTFTMTYGSSAVYTVQKAGYNWTPNGFAVNNIQANTAQNFTGTLLTYTVNITSTPADADIYVNGIDSGFNTPHTFIMNYGTSATYTVQKAGYTWLPGSFAVNNIQANAAQDFTGTQLTYTVNITSIPSDADIFVNGVDSGFNTPHVFTMNHGSSATYTVQKAGYSWSPTNFTVTGINQNMSNLFNGTLLTYAVNITSTPADADIFINGQDSGFNTPHIFTMNHGSSATYTVQKPGYSWSPATYAVTNITANAAQNFTGTQLTYTVNITSTPTDADIFVNGVDSGFNTPHVFTLPYGANAVYTVQKAGYSWTPATYVVNNITANTTQNFTGALLTYTVNITSTPADADIYVNGVDSGFNTPHVFTLTHGSNATYTVQKTGYIWSPANFVVSNIQSNTSQNFSGAAITLSVTPANQNVSYQAGTATFNILSNSNWSITEAVDWLAVTPMTGTGNGNISVSYTANTATTSREGQITITCGTLMQTVTVTQAGAPIILNVEPLEHSVSSQAGTLVINVTSNITWTVSEAENWLSATPAGGSNDGTITVSYNANTSTSARVGQITITGSNITRTIIITQAGAPLVLSVNPANQVVAYQSGSTSFVVTANVAWTVSESVPWFSVTPMNGANNGMLTVIYTANQTVTPRTGIATITGGGMEVSISVTQNGTPEVLIVSPTQQYVTNQASSVTYMVESNIPWTVSEDEEWLSLVAPAKNVTGSFTIAFLANPTSLPRTGAITVSGGEITRTVYVIQAAGYVDIDDNVQAPMPSLIVYPNPFSANATIRVDVKEGSSATLDIYSSKGQHIKSLGAFNKGSYTLNWDGKDESGRACSNGFYIVRYKSAELTKTVKVMLIQK